MSTKRVFGVTDILTGTVSLVFCRMLQRSFVAEGFDITTEQWIVLSSLWKEDRVSQQALCVLTGKDKPSMTRLIDNLEKKGYVVRVSDASDRRINLVHLTSKGDEIRIEIGKVVNNLVNKALSGISEDRIQSSLGLLVQILDNLQLKDGD